MAEVKNGGEPTLPTQRNPDPSCPESKKQKLENADQNLTPTEEHIDGSGSKDLQASDSKNEVVQKTKEAEPEVASRQEVEEEEAEQSRKAVIDRKGKGILIEEEEDMDSDDDDDDDSSDADVGDNLSGCESDLSDDPLAEVDLDNILPSRTRRRVIQPGAYIANDMGIDLDDDSDDSDA